MTQFHKFQPSDILTLILAGGEGKRLYPLTKDRAKPAVPFGGCYRIIDFTLSNCINSGLRRAYVLTQYKSSSLQRHLHLGWNFLNYELGEFIEAIPPQQRVTDQWYQGTADAIFQNIYTLQTLRPRYVLILSGDHIYECDYREMIDFHLRTKADLSVATIEIPVEEASRFGIVQADTEGRMVGFQEKPKEAKLIPGRTDVVHGSMGVYLFNTDVLVRTISKNAKERNEHDFGKNIIPTMLDAHRVMVYPFGDRYWRDIGTLDSYYQAHMELLGDEPPFNLFNSRWPIRTYHPPVPPALIRPGDGPGVRRSLIAPGCAVRGSSVDRSVLFSSVGIGEGTSVEGSVLFEQVQIGRNCRIRNTIIDKHVRIPDGTVIGENAADDARRFHTAEGVVVLPRAFDMEDPG